MGIGRSVPISSLHVQRTASQLFNAAVCEIQGFRDTQEDAHNIVQDVNNRGIMLFGVYDGHGGSLCSRYLSEEVPQAFSRLERITDFQTITDICIQLDRRFMASGKQDGSTCCIVLAQLCSRDDDSPIEDYRAFLKEIKNNRQTFVQQTRIKLVSVNIGDSRAVILRRLALFPDIDKETGQPCDDDSLDDSAYFEPITVDHKPTDPGELQRIMQAGGFVEMGRVDGSLALSRAFGDSAYKVPAHLPEDKKKVVVIPEFQVHYLDWGDVLFVSCDGIFEAERMSYSEVAQELVLSVIKGSKQQNDLISEQKDKSRSNAAQKSKMDDLDDAVGGGQSGTGDDTNSAAANREGQGEEGQNGNQPQANADGMEPDSALDSAEPPAESQTIPPTDSQLYNFDPALPCRDIIQRSLDAGSKDNHTALVVGFKPPMFLTPEIASLPANEVIPAPFAYHASNDNGFENDYLQDISPALDENMRELVNDLDTLWNNHHYQYTNPACVEAVKKRLKESNHSTLLPIMYGNYGAAQQQQQSYHSNQYGIQYTGYDDDDDDDYHNM